jgi:hypothetical protein
MNHDWQKDLEIHEPQATTALPPAMVEETGWDVLLALHSDPRGELSLAKLAAIASVSLRVLHGWLAGLEERHLITGTEDQQSSELRALLTPTGRDLLDRYLSATSGLQLGTHH